MRWYGKWKMRAACWEVSMVRLSDERSLNLSWLNEWTLLHR